jgi:pimeloyl-ACP methyl ester carboxylesterase
LVIGNLETNMALPILLLHGFPFDGLLWRRQVEFLQSPAGGGFRMSAPDLMGFGAMPRVAAPEAERASIEGYAEEAHQMIGQLGGRAIVGGFSMGGYILLALLRAHPADVSGAMFINTRAEADSAEARANRLKSIEEVRASGTGGLVETMIVRLLGKNPTAALKDEMRTMMSRQSAAAVIAAQSAMARRRDQTDLLPQLKVPALIVVGAEDTVTPPVVARGMQALIPGSRLVEIPGAGHMTPLEAPKALSTAIRDFAAGVTA